MKSKHESFSPLKDKPLRNPGQSLDEEIQRVFDDEITFWFYYAGAFLALVAFEWYRWYFQPDLHPLFLTLLCICVVGYSGRRVYKAYIKIRSLRLGRDGERAVGQFLERFRADGAQVFHDVVGSGFNVDHVIVCPRGIFTIETKTLTKPVRSSHVRVVNEQILVNNQPLDRDPFTQSKAQARWLKETITESTGKSFSVHPVVVFPGWFVEPVKGPQDVWVLNPKALQAFIEHSRMTLKDDEVKLVSYHLSRHIRTS